MERKYRIDFNEKNVQESVTYVMVSEFNLVPNVLKAEIEGDSSGVMVVSVSGDEAAMDAAEKRLTEAGFSMKRLGGHIIRDRDRCFDCGACVSLCPVRVIYHDKDDWTVNFDTRACIACGSCVNACSVKAIKLFI